VHSEGKSKGSFTVGKFGPSLPLSDAGVLIETKRSQLSTFVKYFARFRVRYVDQLDIVSCHGV
jgi:hypothetical protein